jgi:hypothetical protein
VACFGAVVVTHGTCSSRLSLSRTKEKGEGAEGVRARGKGGLGLLGLVLAWAAMERKEERGSWARLRG